MSGAVEAATAEDNPVDRTPIDRTSGIGFFTIFPGIIVPFFLGAVDQSIVATALPTIARELGGLTNISWVVISFLLTQTVAVPIWGRLSDLYGRRRMLQTALSILLLASALCSAAPNLTMLILARAVQGMGGGGLHTLSTAILAEVVPTRERAKYQGYLASIFITASVAGPAIGGFLSLEWGWRSVFWIQLPIGLVALILTWRLPKLGRTAARRLNYDFLGTALFILAAACGLFGMTEIGRAQDADFGIVGGLFAAAIAVGLVFARYERRVATPFLSPDIIGVPSISHSALAIGCFAAGLVGVAVFVPMFLQVAKGWTSDKAGLVLMPVSVGAVTVSSITGMLIARTGRTTIFPLCGLPATMIALLMVAAAAYYDLSGWWLVPILLLFGFGGGTVNTTCMFVAQNSVPKASLGAATSAVNFGRAVGGAVGTALVGSVLFATMSLLDPGMGQLMQHLIGGGAEYLASLAPGDRAGIDDALRIAFALTFGTLALFPAFAWLAMWRVPMRRLADTPVGKPG